MRITEWHGQTGEVKQVWDAAHSGVVRGVAFSPDERLLASVGEDKTVKLWDVPTRTLWLTPEGNKGVLAAVAFSPDGKLLATGGNVKEDDKYLAEVILWDSKTWKVKQTLSDQVVFVNTHFLPMARPWPSAAARVPTSKKTASRQLARLTSSEWSDRPQNRKRGAAKNVVNVACGCF